MTTFTPELIAKARAVKSTAELLALAKANNVTLTEAEAETYFAQLHTNGILSDDELDVVAGGNGCGNDGSAAEEKEDGQTVFEPWAKCPSCGAPRTSMDLTCPKCKKSNRLV